MDEYLAIRLWRVVRVQLLWTSCLTDGAQVFNSGNTDIEKRFIFYKPLIPLFDFGRERGEVDLSKVVLTHRALRKGANATLDLRHDDREKLPPIDAPGTEAVQGKDRVLLAEIIEKMNGLF